MKTVAVSEEAIAALRRVVAGRSNRPARSEKVDTVAAAAPERIVPIGWENRPAWTPPARGAAPAVAAVPAVTLPTAPEVALSDGDKPTRWAALLAAVTSDPVCRSSVRPEKKVVLGVGSLDARIMFVGEAPGAGRRNFRVSRLSVRRVNY